MRKILKYWFRHGNHGNFMVINGSPRTGKTNLGCLIIESLRDMGFDIITTIKLKKNYSGVHHVAYFSQFLRVYAEDITGDSVFIVDDAQSSMGTSTEATTKKGRNNTKLTLYIGKFQCNLIYISHIEEYLPRNIGDFNPLYIEKPSKKTMFVMDRMVDRIPKTKLPYDTFSPSHWGYDIDIDKLFYHLSIVPQDQIKSAILAFLDGGEYDPLKDMKKEICMWLLDHGYPKKKPNEIFGSSYYRWKKELEGRKDQSNPGQ